MRFWTIFWLTANPVILPSINLICELIQACLQFYRMNIKKTECQEPTKKLCKKCALFYGSEVFSDLCSSCYRKSRNLQKEEIQHKANDAKVPLEAPIAKTEHASSQVPEPEPAKHLQSDRKRCFECRRKLGLLGIECKCGFVFCNRHRLPEEHTCAFDHHEAGKQKLAKQMPKVQKGKIENL